MFGCLHHHTEQFYFHFHWHVNEPLCSVCESVFSAPEKTSLIYYTESMDISNQLPAPRINVVIHSYVPPECDFSIHWWQQLPLIPLVSLTTPSAICRINLRVVCICQPGHVIYPVHLLVQLSFHFDIHLLQFSLNSFTSVLFVHAFCLGCSPPLPVSLASFCSVFKLTYDALR